jgi:hypothetical protein
VTGMIARGVAPIGVPRELDTEQYRVEVEMAARVAVYGVRVVPSALGDGDWVLRSTVCDVRTDHRVGDVVPHARADRVQAPADPLLGRGERQSARADGRSWGS